LVVTGRGLMAARTDCSGPLAGPHEDLDALAVGTEASPTVDKPSEVMAAVQNRDEFHGAEANGGKSLLP